MPAIRHLFARGARKMAALLDRAPSPPAPRAPAPSLPPGKTHEAIAPGLLASPGVEIGAFKTPIPGITPIQVDLLAEFAREPTLAEYMGSAIDLPFEDSSLNYVASSHVIEHVANPLAAFQEWYRVLRHGGVIYMVVPDRRLTFDRGRPLTTVEHLIDDYRKNTTPCDGTHIEDLVFNADWSELFPETPEADVPHHQQDLCAVYKRAVAAGEELNIHFHTYQPATMVALIDRANEILPLGGGSIDLMRVETFFPDDRRDGFLVVATIRKPGPMPVFASPEAIFRAGAVKFERDARA